MFNKLASGVWGKFVEQQLELSSNFISDQILTIIAMILEHFVVQLKSDLDVQQTGLGSLMQVGWTKDRA